MRSRLIASALCIPAAGSAQAIHAGVSHMVAIMDAPAFAFQAGAVRAGLPHVFSGIVAPVRLTSVQLAPTNATLPQGEVVVQYTVSKEGVPEDVHIVKPLAMQTDEQIVEAVRRVRYAPGKLNGEPIATPVTLHVSLTR